MCSPACAARFRGRMKQMGEGMKSSGKRAIRRVKELLNLKSKTQLSEDLEKLEKDFTQTKAYVQKQFALCRSICAPDAPQRGPIQAEKGRGPHEKVAEGLSAYLELVQAYPKLHKVTGVCVAIEEEIAKLKRLFQGSVENGGIKVSVDHFLNSYCTAVEAERAALSRARLDMDYANDHDSDKSQCENAKDAFEKQTQKTLDVLKLVGKEKEEQRKKLHEFITEQALFHTKAQSQYSMGRDKIADPFS